MLTVLSNIAEFERDLILQRTAEGCTRAMAEGKKFGRRPKVTRRQMREMRGRRLPSFAVQSCSPQAAEPLTGSPIVGAVMQGIAITFAERTGEPKRLVDVLDDKRPSPSIDATI